MTHLDHVDNAENQDVLVERYRGLAIMRVEDGGMYACNGSEFVVDGAETLAEARADIDEYMQGPDDPRVRQMIGWA